MNPILQGLQEGYGEDEILSFLTRAVPQLGNTIQKATRSGYKASQILGFLSKNFDTESLKGKSESQIHAANRRADSERTKYGLKAAATAIATPIAASAARSALSRALPTNLTNGLTQTLSNSVPNASPSNPQSPSDSVNPNVSMQPQPQLPNQAQALSQQPPLNNPNAASIPEPANIEQPKQNSSMVDKLYSGFEKGRDKGFDFESDAFLKIAKRMKSTGEITSKEDFEKFFTLFDAKKNEGKDLPTALKEASIEYDNQKLSPTEQLTQNEEPQLQETEQLQEPIEKPEVKAEAPKIEKNSVVSSPNGIGEVKEIRNGQAIIEVDGKLHKVKEEDLEASPMPEKDLSELYDDLIKGIEKDTEEDVSRMVQWAGYNPDTNTLQFLPHSGSLYTYDEISPEDAQLLTDVLSVRKTSGSNFIGAWKKDSKSPIGAALSKLIRKLQTERGGKGNEYSAKHETIYSAYEPAIEAKKKKKKK